MDLNSLKRKIESLSVSDPENFSCSIREILMELVKRIEKIEALESNLALLLENYVCANIEGLLLRDNAEMITDIEDKKKRFRLREKDIDLEIDCLVAGKIV